MPATSNDHDQQPAETQALLSGHNGHGHDRPPARRLQPTPALIIVPLFLHVLAASLTFTPASQFFMRWLCAQLKALDDIHHASDSWLPLGFSRIPGSSPQLPSLESCRAPPYAIPVQELVATWSMILSLCTSVPAILTIPIISIILDKSGRAFVIKLPVLSLLTGVLGLISLANLGFGMWILILTHLIQGFLGGFQAMVMVVFCYLSDCTTARRRTTVFAQMEALLFMAFLTGPYLGGVLAKLNDNPANAFYASMAAEVAVLLYVLLLLPESLGYIPPDHDSTPRPANTSTSIATPTPPSLSTSSSTPALASLANVKSNIMETMSVFLVSRHDSTGRKQGKVSRLLLVTIAFLMAISFAGLQFSFVFYTVWPLPEYKRPSLLKQAPKMQALKFGWESDDGGLFLLVLGIGRIFSVAIVLPSILKTIPNTATPAYRTAFELWIIRVAILCNMIGFIFLGLATAGWQFYVIGLADSFGAVTLPMVRAVLSRSLDSNLQGRLFSAIALVETLSGAFSPLLFGVIYRTSVSFMPNLIFFVIGGAYAVALFITAGLRVRELVLPVHVPPILPYESHDSEANSNDVEVPSSPSYGPSRNDTDRQRTPSTRTLALGKIAEIESEVGLLADRGV
ncbi:hypothetical protein SeLEV6574_g00764 [Synchytrium endobioticum]|uniref:Major facilitator superfamily (MFS) profile domain-containing protein n=1 Tax=Synchytrium endobioticum TaxID=286115 RepID=A0A507DH83_9FUNG|nr:hypothetical protein SeLEV6574_g00764 [Synchytrium endobioticum]